MFGAALSLVGAMGQMASQWAAAGDANKMRKNRFQTAQGEVDSTYHPMFDTAANRTRDASMNNMFSLANSGTGTSAGQASAVRQAMLQAPGATGQADLAAGQIASDYTGQVQGAQGLQLREDAMDHGAIWDNVKGGFETMGKMGGGMQGGEMLSDERTKQPVGNAQTATAGGIRPGSIGPTHTSWMDSKNGQNIYQGALAANGKRVPVQAPVPYQTRYVTMGSDDGTDFGNNMAVGKPWYSEEDAGNNAEENYDTIEPLTEEQWLRYQNGARLYDELMYEDGKRPSQLYPSPAAPSGGKGGAPVKVSRYPEIRQAMGYPSGQPMVAVTGPEASGMGQRGYPTRESVTARESAGMAGNYPLPTPTEAGHLSAMGLVSGGAERDRPLVKASDLVWSQAEANDAALANSMWSPPSRMAHSVVNSAVSGAKAASPQASIEMVRQAPNSVWEYKPEFLGQPGTAPGPQTGPMAGDLEKTPAGRVAVSTGPDGMKRVDPARIAMQTVGAVSDIDARLRRLEGR